MNPITQFNFQSLLVVQLLVGLAAAAIITKQSRLTQGSYDFVVVGGNHVLFFYRPRCSL